MVLAVAGIIFVAIGQAGINPKVAANGSFSPTPVAVMSKLLGASTSTPPPTATFLPPTPPPPPHLAIVPRVPIWSDEFNAPVGTSPNPTKWHLDTGGGGWGNNEWEYYTNSPANASQDGQGHLVITARRPVRAPGNCSVGPCDITSARLETQGLFAGTYGRFEARIKAPVGLGLWPAFWLLPDDDIGEIDIMETNGRDPGIVSGTLHGPGTEKTGGLSRQMGMLPGNMADEFHIYAVDWTPAGIVWSVDGQVFHTVKRTDPRLSHWAYDKPFYVLLNLAVGSEDPGYPDATTSFPAKMLVDYVRVYR